LVRLTAIAQQNELESQHKSILAWLSPVDYDAQQQDKFKDWLGGTGQWLLDSSKFTSWVSSKGRTLLCHGIPGAGKTTLTSAVVYSLHDRFKDDSNVGIAWIYCRFDQEMKYRDILASILRQLSSRCRSFPENVKQLYERHRRDKSWPSGEEISKELQTIVKSYSRTLILVDALDECHSRRRLVSELLALQNRCGANIFATSRFATDMEMRDSSFDSLQVRAQSADILAYLREHMWQLPSYVEQHCDLKERIEREVVEATDGMLVKLLRNVRL
jgi:AAA domain